MTNRVMKCEHGKVSCGQAWVDLPIQWNTPNNRAIKLTHRWLTFNSFCYLTNYVWCNSATSHSICQAHD